MTNQDSGDNAYQDAEKATPPSGGALVPQSAELPVAAGFSAGPPRQDVIRGGMDGASLFHSFRRRWLLALCMGMVAGALVGAALFISFPESSSAVSMFQVLSKNPTIIGGEIDTSTTNSFDTYRRTQMVLITSPLVLNAAFADNPELTNNPVFKEVEGEKVIDWLAQELQVSFPQDSEILKIKLTGTARKEDLATVVEAVSSAYMDEVVFVDHSVRFKPLEILQTSANSLDREIGQKADLYYDLLKESGDPRGIVGIDTDTKLMLSEMAQLQKAISSAETDLQMLNMSWRMYEAQMKDPAILEMRINEAVAADPTIAGLQQQASFIQSEISGLQGIAKGGRSPAISRKEAELRSINQQIAATEEGLRSSLEASQSDEPDPYFTTEARNYQIRRQALEETLIADNSRLDEVAQELRAKGEVNVDIEMKAAELEQLRSIQRAIADRIERWQIEQGAPQRVTRQGNVETTAAINTTQRYAITGLGGLATFAVTCFGIAYMEFRNRKLNGPEQVDEGLGIRVIGTLPSLSGRAKLDARHPVVAQLTESIDSVRTALMHESTTKRRQVVLVTSAAAMEGRTTVASQLAASLARAGRRTLLIDGDLRRPALHTLFDAPLEDGLSEVLRAETEVADVVRATHAEGLWLMTAGYCDADAVHALATDQAQPIFDKLRADYDFIIIDGAPVLGLSDSLLFGQHCDGAVLSVLRDYTNVPKIHQAAELLKSVGIRLIGAVVNGVPIKADRRVTHLQQAGAKSDRKQLENAEA